MPILIWLAPAGIVEAQKKTVLERPVALADTRLLPQPASAPIPHHARASPLGSVKSCSFITPWGPRVMSLVSAAGLAAALGSTGKRRPSLRVTSRVTSLLGRGV